jgi:23S rRNA (guanosine2251-2'-O)-methyltransferase
MSKKIEWIVGWHAVQQLMHSDFSRIVTLFVDDERHDARAAELLTQATEQGLSIQKVSRKTLDKLTDNATHQGIAVRCKPNQTFNEHWLYETLQLIEKPLILILDGIQDPHNLGACLRSADAAGVCAVVIPQDRAVGLTPTVRKIASGAAETVPLVQVTNLARCLRTLQELGVQLVGLAGEAEKSLYQTHLQGKMAFILGAEEKGLRRLTREHCDLLVKIPMLGQVESLNVSVAAGICLFEAVRQRITS